jgi:hypothetical protein
MVNMALEPGRRSVSPESSGRNTPTPRQWKNQLSAEDPPIKDKHYRKYAAGVERALSLFETALQEWADYISFLSKLLKVSIPRVQERAASAMTDRASYPGFAGSTVQHHHYPF